MLTGDIGIEVRLAGGRKVAGSNPVAPTNYAGSEAERAIGSCVSAGSRLGRALGLVPVQVDANPCHPSVPHLGDVEQCPIIEVEPA
jgi:hypothetical protein